MNILNGAEMSRLIYMVDCQIDTVKSNLAFYKQDFVYGNLDLIESITNELTELTRIKARLEVMLEQFDKLL
ncbi:hypothetical protein EnPhBC-611_gp63 [Enterococcus phage BC611]|uniref:Uncharacterized protein n=1 Tax=Enterococcus phage BC611 TaxID=1173135 RepID=K0IS09_9CAUD|nr:hypothetical protein EnPhBC-611_gp63 [Enterococcus phage BC611]QAY01562.1 hypothetical protein EfsWh1_91 [Enterococcus phage EfsWh-1]BAM44944.1 unnamed protein product [Enterococcus phage BC611]